MDKDVRFDPRKIYSPIQLLYMRLVAAHTPVSPSNSPLIHRALAVDILYLLRIAYSRQALSVRFCDGWGTKLPKDALVDAAFMPN